MPPQCEIALSSASAAAPSKKWRARYDNARGRSLLWLISTTHLSSSVSPVDTEVPFTVTRSAFPRLALVQNEGFQQFGKELHVPILFSQMLGPVAFVRPPG